MPTTPLDGPPVTTQTEAHPPVQRWRVETFDEGEWTAESRAYDSRPSALNRYRAECKAALGWSDGQPVQLRLVRETTAYAVEEIHSGSDER